MDAARTTATQPAMTTLVSYTLRSGKVIELAAASTDSDAAIQTRIDAFVAAVRKDSRGKHTPLWLAYGGLDCVREFFAGNTVALPNAV